MFFEAARSKCEEKKLITKIVNHDRHELAQRNHNYLYLFSSFSSEFGRKLGGQATVQKKNDGSWLTEY
jgi:hypothetical protein